MKKEYECPQIEIVEIESEDVICTSNTTPMDPFSPEGLG